MPACEQPLLIIYWKLQVAIIKTALSYTPLLNKGYHQQRKMKQKKEILQQKLLARTSPDRTCSPHDLGSDFHSSLLTCMGVCTQTPSVCAPYFLPTQTCTPSSLNSVFPSSFFLPHWYQGRGITSVPSPRIWSPEVISPNNAFSWFNFLCHILYHDSKSPSMMLIQAKNFRWKII